MIRATVVTMLVLAPFAASAEESTAYSFGKAIGSVLSEIAGGAKDTGAGMVAKDDCEQHYSEMSDACLEEWRDTLARAAVAVEREVNRRRSGSRG
jgi:hypothetical protein